MLIIFFPMNPNIRLLVVRSDDWSSGRLVGQYGSVHMYTLVYFEKKEKCTGRFISIEQVQR